MSDVRITGSVQLPLSGDIPEITTLRFVALHTYGGLLKGAESKHTTDASGAYDFSLAWGTFAVYERSSGPWNLLGKVVVNEDTVADLSISYLLESVVPLAPAEIAQVAELVQEAKDIVSNATNDLNAIVTDADTNLNTIVSTADTDLNAIVNSASTTLSNVTATDRAATTADRAATAADVVTAEAAKLAAVAAKTSAETARDQAEQITGLDTVTDAVALALAESNQYAMTKAEFMALAEQRKRDYVGSGFIEWGKHRPGHEVAEGMFTDVAKSNLINLGDSYYKTGKSSTTSARVFVAGAVHKLENAAYERFIVKFPEAEQGTRSYDSNTGEVIDYLTDIDPKYGDIATDVNEAVARNFEGMVKNGDFRNGTASWNSRDGASLSVTNGVMSVTDSTGNGGSGATQSINLIGGVKYRISGFTGSNGEATGWAAVLIEKAGEPTINIGRDNKTDKLEYFEEEFTPTISASWSLNLREQGSNVGDISRFKEISIEPLTKSVITSRQDYCFLETFHEKVSDKDIVMPFGNVQYGVVEYNDIPLVSVTTLGINQGYSAFGEWDKDTKGYAAKWSTLTATQKKTFLDDPDNNLYFDAESNELIQVRYRVRVVKGRGSSWRRVAMQDLVVNSNDALSYSDILNIRPRGVSASTASTDFISAPRWGFQHTTSPYILAETSSYDPTLGYAGDSNYETLAVDGQCFALPICLVQRGNQGAYHPVYNPDGFGGYWGTRFSGTTANWYNSKVVPINSTAECFASYLVNEAASDGRPSGTYSGNINRGAEHSGRQDQYKYYDAIYAGQVQDLRLNANKQNPSRLLEDSIRKAVSGETRGKGKQVFSTVYDDIGNSESVYADNLYNYNGNSNILVLYIRNTAVNLFYVGEKVFLYDQTEAVIVSGIVLSRSETVVNFTATVISGDLTTGDHPNNTVYYIREEELDAQYDSLPWVDIIGSPENIMATFPNGVVGKWIPQIAPDSSNYRVTLNKKYNGKGYLLKTNDLGESWSVIEDSATDFITNSRVVNGNDYVQLLSYEALSKFTEPDDNTAVYGEVGDVWVNSYYQISTGNRLLPSLIDRVAKDNVVGNANCIYSKSSYIISGYSFEVKALRHIKLSLITPNNDSLAVKALYHLIEKDGLLYLQYHGRELQHDGTDWGDDNTVPIIDGESTMLDDNGTTVKTFTHTELFPIGIASYTESN